MYLIHFLVVSYHYNNQCLPDVIAWNIKPNIYPFYVIFVSDNTQFSPLNFTALKKKHNKTNKPQFTSGCP